MNTFGNNIFTYTDFEIVDNDIYYYGIDDIGTWAALNIVSGLMTIINPDDTIKDEFVVSS